MLKSISLTWRACLDKNWWAFDIKFSSSGAGARPENVLLVQGITHLRMTNWTVVLEKTLESALDCKEIKPVNPTGNESWIFIGRTDAEAETPILWPPDVKNWLTGKDPDAGKDWRQEKNKTTEDKMVGWHHQLNVHEFEQASSVGDGQGSLAFCSPWGHKELDMTEWLNWTELNLEKIAWVLEPVLVLLLNLASHFFFSRFLFED